MMMSPGVLGNTFAPDGPLALLALSPPGWGGVLLTGLGHSLSIAVGAYTLGLAIGILGAYGKLYGGEIARDLLTIYTGVIRSVPELLLILLLYYAVPAAVNGVLAAMGAEPVSLPQVVVGTVVLGVVLGAYMTEVLRGAILAVPHGQIESARAYGMTPVKIARRITFPQMVANAIGGMANQWLNVTKDTALLAVIGFNELTLSAKQAAGTTKHYFLFFFTAGVLYMILSVCSGQAFGLFERWARRGQPDHREAAG